MTTDKEVTGIEACLPAPILHIAAQFASTDEAKRLLQCIYATKSDKGIEIASTDGHRLFRFVMPFKTASDLYKVNSSIGLKLDAKLFKKKVNYAKDVIIGTDNAIEFIGGKGKHKDLLEKRHQLQDFDGVYPNYNQLFPDSFSNEPKKPIAFSSKYLSEFCQMVTKYSNGTLKMVTNHPTTPILFTACCDVEGLEGFDLEYLLMPIQIRL
tara:strand:+ start:1828 stop:2457 length:630 start_codon:yes stop_codon:yes gene_type:complete